KAVPATEHLTANGFARLSAHGFDAVLRVFELRRPRLWSVRRLIHVDGHVDLPSDHQRHALGLITVDLTIQGGKEAIARLPCPVVEGRHRRLRLGRNNSLVAYHPAPFRLIAGKP